MSSGLTDNGADQRAGERSCEVPTGLMVLIMKKIILSFLLCLTFTCSVFAYEIPDKSFYITFDTSNYGQICVYLPYNYADFFAPSGNSIVNVYSGTVSGFGVVGNTQYDVRFTTFNSPEIRSLNGNYQWTTLNVRSIVDTNLPILNDTSFSILSQGTIINLLILLVGGVIVCLLFMRL